MGRPVGITMLSVLAILSGVLGGLVVVMPFASQANLGELTQHVGMPSWLLLGSLIFTALMSFLSGVGMWEGKPWGWWLAAFGFVYAMLKDANAIWMIPKLIERYGAPDRGAGYYYLKYGFRLFLSAAILAYLYRPVVRAFFRLQAPIFRSLALLIGAALGVFLGMFLLVRLT